MPIYREGGNNVCSCVIIFMNAFNIANTKGDKKILVFGMEFSVQFSYLQRRVKRSGACGFLCPGKQNQSPDTNPEPPGHSVRDNRYRYRQS